MAGCSEYRDSTPERTLADLLNEEGVKVTPEKLKDVLVKRWAKIQTLSHMIHDAELLERGRNEVRKNFKALMGEDGK